MIRLRRLEQADTEGFLNRTLNRLEIKPLKGNGGLSNYS
jgi:hypothetical protein